MVREWVQKKPPRHTLEEIKEKMKVMRNKQLGRAAARSRGTRARLAHQSASSIVPGSLLVAVKQNNTELALALQAEKEKVRQANAIILQLKQTLFFQLMLLRRKLREQQALTTSSPLAEASELPVEANVESPRREKISEGKPCEVSPICAESPKMDVQPDYVRMTLPPTVMVRQRRGDRERKSRRRSDRVRSIGEVDLGALRAERPRRHEDPHEVLKARVDDPICAPDSEPPVNTRKDGRRQARPKADACTAKPPERGRKPERAPLKKPWENPKRRARSKSRERHVPPLQQLNTSLGFNDTFDFDCEGAVHLTPFRAKPNHPEDPVTEPAGDPTPDSLAPDPSSPSSPSSESEDSPYVPKKKPRRACASPETTKFIATRRGRAANTNASRPKSEALSQDIVGSAFPSVSTLTEVDMTIDDVLSRFGDSLCENQPPPPPPPSALASRVLQQQRQRKKCGLGGSRRAPGCVGLTLSDMTNLSPVARRRSSQTLCSSTPATPRMRRRTLVVDYKEPSLSAKLRRGDKFTDLRFLPPGSPVFKNKLTGGPSRASTSTRDKLGKYNESFVGCR
ncbi:shugoshin 1 isoform X2 [Hippocampus comes]|uniref:shugoshin 1 isoform X2 n=1 Tax=Hippocampus comes TaxID=109280 RepID=UPI00094E54E7|nr:PREDICTED: shugoshin 1-like isoform X2 [Hippocampus comes]